MKINKGLVNFIKNFRTKSMFIKNLCIYTALIMIPIIIFVIFFYSESEAMLKDEIKNSNLSNLQRTQDVTDSIIAELERLTISISLQDEVNMYMYSSGNIISGLRTTDKIKERNKNFMNIYKYIDSIYIYSEKREELIDCFNTYSIDTIKDNQWKDYYDHLKKDEILFYLRKKNDVYPNLLTIIKASGLKKDDKIGAVVINVNLEVLGSILELEKNPMSQYSVISDEDGVIYYAKNSSLLDTNIKNKYNFDEWKQQDGIYSGDIKNENSMVAVIKSNKGSFYYISVVPMEYYHQKTRTMMMKSLILAILCIIAGGVVSFFISINAFKPIKQIIRSIQKNDSNIPAADEDKSITDELRYIVGYISQAALTKNDMKHKLDEQLIQLKKAHNVALQSQINPHFLYNTLEVINWKAFEKLHGDNEISRMITNLGDIYEYLLKVNDYWISVGEEINHTKKYIEILKIRYKNKFSVNMDIPSELLDYQIIKLSLQPLVENAVYHGIKPKHSKGIINISAQKNANIIKFQIKDDGVGINEQKLKELQDALNSQFTIDDDHIGMTNVNQRIKVVFGSKYGVEIESKENIGTTVTLIFPAEK